MKINERMKFAAWLQKERMKMAKQREQWRCLRDRWPAVVWTAGDNSDDYGGDGDDGDDYDRDDYDYHSDNEDYDGIWRMEETTATQEAINSFGIVQRNCLKIAIKIWKQFDQFLIATMWRINASAKMRETKMKLGLLSLKNNTMLRKIKVAQFEMQSMMLTSFTQLRTTA